MAEAHDALEADGVAIDVMRIRAFPFPESVRAFIEAHDVVFVVEQNRDAQLRTLLMKELEIEPKRLVSILHYDGTPITARFIHEQIGSRTGSANVTPLKRPAEKVA
jgi:2-oxoglutarate ferredoxin oxidoreductase subunit alpha